MPNKVSQKKCEANMQQIEEPPESFENCVLVDIDELIVWAALREVRGLNSAQKEPELSLKNIGAARHRTFRFCGCNS